MPELKKGYQGAEYYPWYDWAKKYASSYAFMLGNRDGYFGAQEDAFVREMQRRLGIPQNGVFGQLEASRTGYKWASGSIVVAPRYRKIWIDTSPGSGADWWLGPSFDLGNRVKADFNINHQPVSFQKGGYLGVMGGDPTFSYNDVIWDQCKSIEWLWDNRADAQEALKLAEQYARAHGYSDFNTIPDSFLKEIASQLEYENHGSGYSQSADGLEEAYEYLLGDAGYVHPGDKSQTPSTGKYRLLRHCLKLVVQFGNPSTPVTGIARKTRSPWLAAKVRNVNYDNDFYAKVPLSDVIRPRFYAIIVEAEMELPFGVHVLRVAVPVILEYLKFVPILGQLAGGTFGPLAQILINGATGITTGLTSLGNLMGQAGSDKDQQIDADLINLLKPTGLLTNAIPLIQLVGAVGPGLDAHGRYPFDPVKMDEAYAHIRDFRR